MHICVAWECHGDFYHVWGMDFLTEKVEALRLLITRGERASQCSFAMNTLCNSAESDTAQYCLLHVWSTSGIATCPALRGSNPDCR